MGEFHKGEVCEFRGEESSDLRFMEGSQSVVVGLDWNREWKYLVFVYDREWHFLGETWCVGGMLEKKKVERGRREKEKGCKG